MLILSNLFIFSQRCASAGFQILNTKKSLSDILNDGKIEKIEGGGFLRKSSFKSSSFLKKRNMIPRSINCIAEQNEIDGDDEKEKEKEKTDKECDEIVRCQGIVEMLLNSDGNDNDNEENKRIEKNNTSKSLIETSSTRNLKITPKKKRKSKSSIEFDENEIKNIFKNVGESFAVIMTECEANNEYSKFENIEETARAGRTLNEQTQSKFFENNITECIITEKINMQYPFILGEHQSDIIHNTQNQTTKDERKSMQNEDDEGEDERLEEGEGDGEEEVIFFHFTSLLVYSNY